MKKKYLIVAAFCSMTWTNVQAQIISEDFESYSVGDYMGVESADWTTWSGAVGGAEDVQITDLEAASGSNAIYFQTTVESGGPQDVVVPFGDLFNLGQMHFEAKFYVEDNKGAYFNFQGTETVGEVWSMNCQMVNDGQFLVDAGGSPLIETTYPSETWFTIEVDVNFNTNTWEVSLDGVSQGTFAATNNAAASLNLYPVNSAAGGNNQAGYYVDDLAVDYTPYDLPDVNAGVILIGNTSGLAGTGISPSGTIRNLGVNAISSFDLEMTYNGETIVENVTGVSIASLETFVVQFTDELSLIAGENDIVATVSNVNGAGADGDPADDEKSITLDPVVPADGKVVIGEEGTGTWCGWCPRGAVYLDFMADTYPEHFVGIAVHNGDPMTVDVYDEGIGGLISGYPSLLVDRGDDINPAAVEADFLERVILAPKAVLTIGTDYADGATEMSVSVTADFNEPIAGDYRLALVVIEDGVTGTGSGWSQANSYSGGGAGEMGGYEDLPNPVPAEDMVYDHVARAILPGFSGLAASFPATVDAGEAHTQGFSVTIDPDWDLDEVHLVGILIAPDGTIDNAGYASIADAVNNGYVSLDETRLSSSSINLYPNPAADMTRIDLGVIDNESVSIKIFDLNGKLVTSRTFDNLSGYYILPMELSNLEKGLYSVQVQVGSELSTKKLIVQ